LKVTIDMRVTAKVTDAPDHTSRAIEFTLAQMAEQLEAIFASRLVKDFPGVQVEFEAVEEGR
jgi:hypothetical protein